MRTTAYARFILTASFLSSFLLGSFGTLAILLVCTRSCKEVMVWQRADLSERGESEIGRMGMERRKEKMKTE